MLKNLHWVEGRSLKHFTESCSPINIVLLNVLN